jgi:hypothetical protein
MSVNFVKKTIKMLLSAFQLIHLYVQLFNTIDTRYGNSFFI